ncbi:hypothetical protein RJT34_05585 [Clitoria ternatea]|uniref:Pentatricopeptide repeat-containing protein n=1 Tax=Clitoria ternatea TaxID=43366 RepID=A0AAN9K381_CLITE
MFQVMTLCRIQPNQVTIVVLPPAWGSVGYVKCCNMEENLEDVWNLFDKILCKNAALWNVMIDCFVKCGTLDSSLEVFKMMQEEGLHPNEVTFSCIHSAGIVGHKLGSGSVGKTEGFAEPTWRNEESDHTDCPNFFGMDKFVIPNLPSVMSLEI